MASATILFVPCWESGHFMSMVTAGKRMLDASGGALSLTVLVMRAPTAAKASEVDGHVRREAASGGLAIRFLNLPAVEPPTDYAASEEFNFRYIQRHAPHVEEAIAGLSSPVAAVVVDLFCTALLDVAAGELAVPRYVYFASTGAFLALMLRLPVLREHLNETTGGTVNVPGLPPVPMSYMPKCLTGSKIGNYEWFEHYGRRFMDTNAIIINSSVELEGEVLAAITDGRCVPGRPAPTIHAIGPVLWFAAAREQPQPHVCVQWLDTQPPGSVVFLCFGSKGFVDTAQVGEVAAGLERSGHRFLWVLRGPPVAGSSLPTDADLDAMLPGGFVARTRGRGLVWPSWAPQKEVLAHPAVGGFVTHCGWNSTLESLWFGVPMVPWPLYGEQHLNAFELVRVMGVAVRLKDDMDGGRAEPFVEAAELERAVRGVMGGTEEGRKAREKAAEMKAACRNAVAEGGSSCVALRRLVSEISPSGGGAPLSP
ncbi:hypothetical protein HU200_034253 [Digitaria exilis]|uniref:Glycosyltransferase n=1 Tax=Digitaria exilis TaxID=1010633 RepID=A0A835BTW4_9POAL|nr:hypothetical protein HU200_034253 [Digitaria exilis]